MSNATIENTPLHMKHLSPSSQLAPLAEIMSAQFHIDVSRDEALIVQTNTGTEFPLSLLSVPEADEIRNKACDQYVQSVLSSGDSIDRDRATLFFISRFCDNNRSVSLQPAPERRNYSGRKNHRTSRRAMIRSVRTASKLSPRVSACS